MSTSTHEPPAPASPPATVPPSAPPAPLPAWVPRVILLWVPFALPLALWVGSLYGAIGAFLALSAAAILQAGLSTYLTRHEVMDAELTRLRRP